MLLCGPSWRRRCRKIKCVCTNITELSSSCGTMHWWLRRPNARSRSKEGTSKLSYTQHGTSWAPYGNSYFSMLSLSTLTAIIPHLHWTWRLCPEHSVMYADFGDNWLLPNWSFGPLFSWISARGFPFFQTVAAYATRREHSPNICIHGPWFPMSSSFRRCSWSLRPQMAVSTTV